MTDHNCNNTNCPLSGDESWTEYRKLVLSDIDRMEKNNRLLSDKIDHTNDVIIKKLDYIYEKLTCRIHDSEKTIAENKIDIKEVKAKASVLAAIFGAVFGSLVSAVAAWLIK